MLPGERNVVKEMVLKRTGNFSYVVQIRRAKEKT